MRTLSLGERSLTEIASRSMLGFNTSTQSLSSGIVSTQTSLAFGGITTSFNSELNGFLTDLNAKRVDYQTQVDNQLAIDPKFKGLRGKGVSLAWEYEAADVKMGGRGSVEGGWTDSEIEHIRATGKAKSYDVEFGMEKTPEGHHAKNVADHPKDQANPDNITFYRTRKDHVEKGHDGDVNNSTDGDYIDKNEMLRKTNKRRVVRNELRGIALAAGVGFGIGFTLTAIYELAQKGISSVDFSELVVKSMASGIESAAISVAGYGVSRAATSLLSNIGVDITQGSGYYLNYSIVGLASIAIVSVYQYAKLRFNGVEKEAAIGMVAKQALFSTSVLAVSMIAQSIFGGIAGIVVSTSIGLICFGYGVVKTVHSRNFEEKMRVYTIEQYRRIALC